MIRINKHVNGIHNGEAIHHQLQSILLVNFNTIKIRKSIVPNPIPLFEFLFFIFFFRDDLSVKLIF